MCGDARVQRVRQACLVLVLVHLPGKINIADILTKAQAASVFNELMSAYDALVDAH